MDSIRSQKYKDDLPIQTINRIRNILSDLGILTVETGWLHPAENFYSVNVTVANTTLSTNGKGTTYEFALASAYGELMERLQNQAHFRLNNDVSQEAIEYLGFFYAPDEKRMSMDDLLNSEDEWIVGKLSKYNSDDLKRELLEKWQSISYETMPCDFIAVPFCNLNNGKLSYIPMKMLSKMYMSNGMCAGNTSEEALVQGISEVMERYVNKYIVKGKITPPSIPREYIQRFPRICDMITQIELSGNFEVIIKDCSLGKDFPVIGVIFINKDDQTYFIKFGAHPDFEIAAERTLTELLQGQDIRNMRGIWEFSYKNNVIDEHKNLIHIFANGSGRYPNEIFASNFSYAFSPFTDVSKMDNKKMLKYLVHLLKNVGYDVYVRNVSFLGFPAFHVIVPGFSEIEEINDFDELLNYTAFVNIKRLLRNMSDLSNDELIKIADYLENKNFGLDTNVLSLLNLSLQDSLPWYYMNIELFVLAIYCKVGQYTNAAKLCWRLLDKIQPNSLNYGMITYYKCLRDFLDARADGTPYDVIENMLGKFYPLQIVMAIIEEFGNSETLFRNGLITCFKCEACQLRGNCLYKGTEEVLIKIKERYSKSTIHHSDLTSLLNQIE
ncbi:YcaO-like family protein [Desulfitobacterium sp. Sab5]|uniref:YcaO-like family protein n=1 Tax=Desulfitobacterium nosdiversum TaxID=3375356 RepID=UPI003CE89A00